MRNAFWCLLPSAVKRVSLFTVTTIAILPLLVTTAYAADSCPVGYLPTCLVAANADNDSIWQNFINELPSNYPLHKAVLQRGALGSPNFKAGLCYAAFLYD